MYEQLVLLMESLGWDPSDEIRIELAGRGDAGPVVNQDTTAASEVSNSAV